MIEKLKSRKLWVALLTLVVIMTGRALDVDATADALVVVVSSVYLLAQGWVDKESERVQVVTWAERIVEEKRRLRGLEERYARERSGARS